ncbi:MAG: nucleoside-diphosphate kinase [Micrococcales bacterium]|nr:nucleoside-diphosphate kinase [Micrococcales bacterium]
MSEPQRTLVLIKPDGVRRGLSGQVLARIEAKGYRMVAARLRTADAALLTEHYAEHAGKPFVAPLIAFMSSGPVLALVVEGHRVIEGIRSLCGATDPTTAAPGSIRGDLAADTGAPVLENIIHASDSPESSAREIALWFSSL